MKGIINEKIIAKFNFMIYRFRFLCFYIIFGIFSLLIEFIIRNYFLSLGLPHSYSTFFGILTGIFFAFWSNSKLNFKIPSPKLLKSLFYFLIISSFSASLQFYLSKVLVFKSQNYETNRFLISGIIFLLAYALHRKYSFINYKKVGVAIYINKIENIEEINSKISHYPDFIHIDIVDKTMNKNAGKIKISRFETIKAYWPKTQIQTHIMSTKPSNLVPEVLPFSDVIYIHAESSGQDIHKIIKDIKENKKLVGIAIMITSETLWPS